MLPGRSAAARGRAELTVLWLPLLTGCAEPWVDTDPAVHCTAEGDWWAVHADFELVDAEGQKLGEVDRPYVACFERHERPFRIFLAFDTDGDHSAWEWTLGADLGPYHLDDSGSWPTLDPSTDPGFGEFVEVMAADPDRTLWSVIMGRTGLTEAAPLPVPSVEGVEAMWLDLAIK